MNTVTLRRNVTITNPQGLHMRPATAFAKRAGQFGGTVAVYKDEKRVDGKRILDLIFLGAEQGTQLTVEVTGVGAEPALQDLVRIMSASSPDAEPDRPQPASD